MALETAMMGLINSQYSDFTILCSDGKSFRVMKLLLQSKSDYFRLPDYDRTDTMETALTYAQMRPIVEWLYIQTIYAGSLRRLTVEDYALMASECRAMLLPQLEKAFIDLADDRIHSVGPMRVLALAHLYKLDYLASKCYYYMRLVPACGLSSAEAIRSRGRN